MIKIDFHLHSSFSDGLLTPEELARSLKARRVSVAALTDHDTVDGVGNFLSQCRRLSIKGIAGVELSAAHKGVLHILGYRFDVKNEALRDALAWNRNARERRNILICEKLRELGFDITMEKLKNYVDGAKSGDSKSQNSALGRPHMARFLWNKGYVPSIQAAFDRYLGQRGKAYAPRLLLPAEDCVRLIRGAGGFPVLAHPRQTTPDLDDLPPLLSRLKNAGLWGIECWTRGSGVTDVYRCLKMAAAFGLFPTAGSDFHSGRLSVGVAVGEDILPWASLCGGL
jgi:predicted metal-dependent phosphoesterase TrpH